MFRQIRYQTGESAEIAAQMKNGGIPCLDVNDIEEYNLFVKLLEKHNIIEAREIPKNKSSRDKIKEPEFEFRAAFYLDNIDSSTGMDKKTMYIDVYFEPDFEETYDSVGEM